MRLFRINSLKERLAISWDSDRPIWVIFIISSLLLLMYSEISYANYKFPVLDLGLFNRHMYSLANLDFSANPLKGFNLIGDHAHFFLLFLAPIYKLWPNPRLLLFVQSFAITLSLFPIYYIAKHYLKSQLAASFWVIAYFTFFGFWAALAYSFHDSPVAVLPISWALYHLLVSKKTYKLIFWLALLCLIREDMPMVAAMFGLYTAIFDKKWKVGSLIIIVSIAYMQIVMKYFMPLFGVAYAYNQNPFGSGFVDVVKASFLNTKAVFVELFLKPKTKLETLLLMIGSFGGLSLFAPQVLLMMAPLWAGRTLTDQYWRWSIIKHYSASQAPFLAVSAIVGLALVATALLNFRNHSKTTNHIFISLVSFAVILCSLFVTFKTKNLTLFRLAQPQNYYKSELIKSMDEASNMVPKKESVAVQSPYVNLTTRKLVYNVPLAEGESPNYVIFVDGIDLWPFKSSSELMEYKKSLIENKGYREVYNENKVYLLQK